MKPKRRTIPGSNIIPFPRQKRAGADMWEVWSFLYDVEKNHPKIKE